MNVWLCKQNVNLESRLISRLKSEGLWNKVVWCDNEIIRPKKNTDAKSIESFKEWLVKGTKSKFYELQDDQIFSYITFASRNSVYGGFELDSRTLADMENSFYLLVNYTVGRLSDDNIDLVIFNRPPHYEGDYALYIGAKALKLKTLILEQSKIPNKFFFSNNVDEIFDVRENKKIFNKTKLGFDICEGAHKKEWFYMKGCGQHAKKNLIERIHEKFGDEYRLAKRLIAGPEKLQSIIRYRRQCEFKKNLSMHFEYLKEYESPYLYFALHLQPELSTNVYGGKYKDQLLAIEHLSSVLPFGWKIYVKENPLQNYMQRGDYFYKRLGLIPNVKCVNKDEDTVKLLSKSKVAATISGTVGWEAITGLKPVIVFGESVWYAGLPGVHRFSKDINIEKIANEKIDPQILMDNIVELTAGMGDGIIYPGYENLVESYDDERNLELVSGSLKKIIHTL